MILKLKNTLPAEFKIVIGIPFEICNTPVGVISAVDAENIYIDIWEKYIGYEYKVKESEKEIISIYINGKESYVDEFITKQYVK